MALRDERTETICRAPAIFFRGKPAVRELHQLALCALSWVVRARSSPKQKDSPSPEKRSRTLHKFHMGFPAHIDTQRCLFRWFPTKRYEMDSNGICIILYQWIDVKWYTRSSTKAPAAIWPPENVAGSEGTGGPRPAKTWGRNKTMTHILDQRRKPLLAHMSRRTFRLVFGITQTYHLVI